VAGRNGPRRRLLKHPAQTIVVGFAVVILLGTALLMLPLARSGPGGTDLVTALFTSTSAVCVTGLVVVDTGPHWSTFGEVVILALIQVGGLGIMTFASVVGLLISRRMGLRTRLSAAAETKAVGLADIRKVVIGVVKVSLLVEAVVAVALFLRFWLGYDEPAGRAAYSAVFHAVSAFNNAGFGLYADSLVRYVTDVWVCLPIALAVIFGGLGFPVWFELRREIGRPKAWSMHTKMTLSVTAALLVLGTVFVTASEWSNPATLGALTGPDRLFVGFFHAVMPRTAGFNSLDMAALNDTTLLGTTVLMFIGGGSAGTAGGIKVTTFILLFFVIYAEVRGERRVNVFDRQVDDRVVRQALTVALLSVGAVVGSTLVLMSLTGLPMGPVLFEATSAFATVGLTTGITYDLPTSADLVLVGLMFLGRLGPITLVSALALRERYRHYELPEGRPIIG
jgi:trk system potassium uptake protein TrkH